MHEAGTQRVRPVRLERARKPDIRVLNRGAVDDDFQISLVFSIDLYYTYVYYLQMAMEKPIRGPREYGSIRHPIFANRGCELQGGFRSAGESSIGRTKAQPSGVADHAVRGRSFRRGTCCVVDGRLTGSAGRSRSGEFGFFGAKYDKYERFPKNLDVSGRQVWDKYGQVWCKVWRLIGFDGRRSLRGRAF